MSDASLLAELRTIAGTAHVLTDPDVRAGFERDWTGRFGGMATAVVRPGTTAEVAAVIAACHARAVAVVPQGGNTGLVGGGVPRAGEIVLQLGRLRALGEVDAVTGQVDAGAGATLAAVAEQAQRAGFAFGVDFGARDAATVGGAIATDAGGIRALRHGTMRHQVAGLEAVLADGTIVRRMSGVLKDNAGYALPALVIGSEGTLAVVTAARLRLVDRSRHRVAALVAVRSVDEAIALLAALRRHAPSLAAAELLLDDALQLVLELRRVRAPLPPAPAYVLVECAARHDPLDELAAALEDAVPQRPTAIADDSVSRASLWALREAIPEAIAAAGIPHKLDVGVPLARLAAFLDEVVRLVATHCPGARLARFGHLGDGNVHVNVLGAPADDDRIDAAVLACAAAHGGTISAEHGIGVAKVEQLALVRTPGELAALRALKRALDPRAILNPGVVLAHRK